MRKTMLSILMLAFLLFSAARAVQAGAVGDLSGEITVACYNTALYQDSLEAAAAAFQKQYPGVKVTVNTFSETPDQVTVVNAEGKAALEQHQADTEEGKSDYISKTSTELMSGGGADVLAMDVLPYHKYAAGGLLMDLRPFMDTDASFHKEDYSMNILDAVLYQGGQYMFPIDYGFNFLTYDASLVTPDEEGALSQKNNFSIEELSDIVQTSFEAQSDKDNLLMFGFMSGDGLFDLMLNEHYRDWIDMEGKQAHLDGGEFSSMLNETKEYLDRGWAFEYAYNTPEASGMSTQQWLAKRQAERCYYRVRPSLTLGRELQESANVGSERFFYNGMGDTTNDTIVGVLSNDKSEVPFWYYQAYAVNANTKNPEAAWAFIKFLTGYEMQTSLPIYGLRVNIKARTDVAKQDITGDLNTALNENQQKSYDAYLSLIDTLTAQVNTYLVRDVVIDTMLKTESRSFFEGRNTAEEAAAILQSKIGLYLSE